MKVAISAAFRHIAEEDGRFIPASRIHGYDGSGDVRPELSGSEYFGRTIPMLGYLLVLTEGGKKIWNFMKYEAPERQGTRFIPGNLSTCRADRCVCPNCGMDAPFPARREKKRALCPFCGSQDVQASPIKEGGDEFLRHLGDLEDILVSEAGKALLSGTDFRFPIVLVGGQDVEPDPSVPEDIAAVAQSVGRGFRLADNVAPSSLPDMGLVDFQIVPDPVSGTMDDDVLRKGKAWSSGLFNYYARSFVPKEAPRLTCAASAFRY